ncbi:MAG: discoidin domain-containing protein [Candidatus Eisenbacteria bacterium]|nr:discoidin domain-containing protein [Candidatus Eisenbacteria bacterium]
MSWMRRCAMLAGAALALVSGPVRGAGAVLDPFEDLSAWSAHPADGVELAIRPDTGVQGRCMRLDFRFVKGGGYAIARRALALELPGNYAFSFRVRGACGPQTLEFKLVDSTGANVWWSTRRDFAFPSGWDSVVIRKRHIQFAWGPAGGGEIRHVASLEIVVTAGSGGAGSVWVDELNLRPLPPPDTSPVAPVAVASSSAPECETTRALDGDSLSFWSSRRDDPAPWLMLDLGSPREYGGLVFDWVQGRQVAGYTVEASDDTVTWRTLWSVRGGNRAREYVYAPECESRYVRVRAEASPALRGMGIREIRVQPPAWSATRETFFQNLAQEAPRGMYPRGMSGQQSFWTVLGPDGGPRTCLLGEDGAVEYAKSSASIEPFLTVDGRLLTWKDMRAEQWLQDGDLPMPTVRWPAKDISLTVSGFAAEAGDSVSGLRRDADLKGAVFVRYLVRNSGLGRHRITLHLALRPFQVNPPAQFLNTPGGTARVGRLEYRGCAVRVGGRLVARSLTRPDAVGAAAFGTGEITDFLRQGRVPPMPVAEDPFEAASGAQAFDMTLGPGEQREVTLLLPSPDARAGSESEVAQPGPEVDREFEAARRAWRERLDRVGVALPRSAEGVARSLRAQLAYILVSRSGPALQPGTRSYARSWIRDGSMMCSALLRLGHPEAVKAFLEWFAGYLYNNGKVPCCVDARGSDPVPENDSGGEFLYLVAEYYRYTGDRATVERLWPRVTAAVGYMDDLRAQRRTAEYRAPGKEPYFGLLPESISHEGYSAQPMHSYWDDFWALRGYKDAAWLAGALGHAAQGRKFASARDQFQADLAASVRAAMKSKGIDYVPGCAELGDFDATSTTVALEPAQAGAILPPGALRRTFERYDEFFLGRTGGKPWDAYTPYETRVIGSYVRLGWREKLPRVLEFFLGARKPAGWAQWPEVVWREDRVPKFLGDLPHTWVGSDFARSVLDMLAYVRESDSALVVGAGLPREWMTQDSGVSVRGLRTPFGPLSYRMWVEQGALRVEVAAGLRLPPGGLVVAGPTGESPGPRAWTGVAASAVTAEGPVVRRLPASLRATW